MVQLYVACCGSSQHLTINTAAGTQVNFRNPIRYGLKKELFIASEGMYTGQVHSAAVKLLRAAEWESQQPGMCMVEAVASCHSMRSQKGDFEMDDRILRWLAQAIYAGKKATLTIGNIKPIGEMPEGAIICNVEEVRSMWHILPQHARVHCAVCPVHAGPLRLLHACVLNATQSCL